ncbi:uncharacterized protein N7484_009807 [Penicillium longicatenatum]|uniref:uncharacterized protein n=1 Tax=Penicillium longicatenatum TaxID=1561947 RepID=UPI0025468B5B|nr:uncharacterized protein N7484_009807 [Penicillium longicatenatum]KAJ5636494.1 hypothetical protein N7484_009807 [Penicillium longicatenatum]
MATPTPARPPPSPAVLFIYPATLLLGSLFSVISPTAQGSRGPPRSSQPAGALAPSLAADLHISESPVNYFARKNNIFNIYFVKIGWLWTTLAFASLLIAQPAFHYSASLPQSQQQIRFRRTIQAIVRYAIATTVWYLMTQWFFGPAIIDRSFVITGGKCQELIKQAGEASTNLSPSTQLETVFSAAACKAAGGAWGGGHDISGHVFMLVLTTALLAFEAIGVGAFSLGSRVDGDVSRERKGSDPNDIQTREQDGGSSLARTWSLRFVWGVVGLGWWMLFMTAIWFHTWLEKWSGLFVALSTVYVIYILPRSLAPWRGIVGLPGA